MSVLLSPTLFKYRQDKVGVIETESNIDFWYDSLNDCYTNQMETQMILSYIEALND